MKMIATILALALSASVCASDQTPEKGEIRVEKTFNGVKQTLDKNGLSVARVGPGSENIEQGPYTQARVIVFQYVDGKEKVLASKIVPLNQSIHNYSDSVDYIGDCSKMENEEPKCTTSSAPIGLMADVQYMGTPKNSAPVYRAALGWRALSSLQKFEDDSGMSIDLMNINSREFLNEVAYTQPVEFKGFQDGKIETILRLELL